VHVLLASERRTKSVLMVEGWIRFTAIRSWRSSAAATCTRALNPLAPVIGVTLLSAINPFSLAISIIQPAPKMLPNRYPRSSAFIRGQGFSA
jgi:hypothetical protein